MPQDAQQLRPFADLNVFKWGIFSAREEQVGFVTQKPQGLRVPRGQAREPRHQAAAYGLFALCLPSFFWTFSKLAGTGRFPIRYPPKNQLGRQAHHVQPPLTRQLRRLHRV